MTQSSDIPSLSLNDGHQIPQLGFGVYQIEPENTTEAVSLALETGYRHIDTAKAYANEAEVGKSIRNNGNEVYITTKYFNPDDRVPGYKDAKKHFNESFDDLGMDHIDLYLIHFPVDDKFVESWKALVDLAKTDRVRSIGVSNFTADQLQRIMDATGVVPALNQVELHPYFQNPALRSFHDEHVILTEAWSPLARGGVLDDPVLNDIGDHHDKTAAQVTLRWHLQLGNVIIPKSVTPKYIRENFNIFDFSLSDEEMATIKDLDRGKRNGPDPATYDFPREYMGQAHENN